MSVITDLQLEWGASGVRPAPCRTMSAMPSSLSDRRDVQPSAGTTLSARAGRPPASRPWAWVLGMLGAVALLLVIFQVFVTTSTGQVTEHMALQAATARLETMPPLGETVLRLLPGVVAVTAVLVFLVITVWRRRWLASAIALASFGAANLTTQLLKKVILLRPDLDNGVPYYTGNSLPSGHTTFAAAAVVAVVLVVAPRWRPMTAALGALFATAVGAGTFLETWHRPSDMAAAYLVAVFWGLAGGLLILRTGAEWNTRARRTARHPHPGGHPGWDIALWLGGLLTTVGGMLCYLLAGGREALDPAVPWTSGWHYLGGLLVSVGPGLLVFAVLASFLRWESGRPAARG